jgi:carbonic anhydrase/acetyltransferase-like protein (isoleucine patch superfamily)
MSGTAGSPMLLSVGSLEPRLDDRCWVAPGAVLVGDVRVAADASVWYGSVLRADGGSITVGAGTNIQDGCVAHADEHGDVLLGERISVGHRVILHACTVEDGALIGMGAIVLTGARVGAGSLVAAGAVVREGAVIPAGSLVAGVPAQVRRPLTEAEAVRVRENAESYLDLVARHREVRLAEVPEPDGVQ